jgi:hypothetical protein
MSVGSKVVAVARIDGEDTEKHHGLVRRAQFPVCDIKWLDVVRELYKKAQAIASS